ncbi:MAG TPA: bacterioferritin [Burkholderiaceae bacterium]|nr:bacterioferritin [Burkholderiaceae bacterium]
MKSDPQIITRLNEYLCFETTGHVQYLFHAALCEHDGFSALARIQADYSAEESQHSARIMARILMLDGLPAPKMMHAVGGLRNVPEQFEADRELVGAAIVHLRTSIGECEQRRDFVTRDLLREMLDDEERHLYWLDKQVSLLGDVGIENYLQAML